MEMEAETGAILSQDKERCRRQKLEETGSLPKGLQGSTACSHLDFGLLTSRTVGRRGLSYVTPPPSSWKPLRSVGNLLPGTEQVAAQGQIHAVHPRGSTLSTATRPALGLTSI